MKVWDLKSYTQLACPVQHVHSRGPVSCVMWITQQDDLSEGLCYGTALGYLIIWQQIFPDGFKERFARRVGTGVELTCMACDNKSSAAKMRIITGTRDKVIQVWKFDYKGGPQSVFSVQLGVTVPKAVSFVNNTSRDVYVFGLFDGYLYGVHDCTIAVS
jgi:hypothetical protein